jgi:hypothetical protein
MMRVYPFIACALLAAWPLGGFAQSASEQPPQEEAVWPVLVYTSTTTLGLGSSVGTTVGLISILQSPNRSAAQRAELLRSYLIDGQPALSAAAALGGGEAVDVLAMIFEWEQEERAALGRLLRRERRAVVELAALAVEDDAALLALCQMFEREL